MKTPEDEAFDDLARRQGAWGGGFPAKKAMAADKLQDVPETGFGDMAQPAQEPTGTLNIERLDKWLDASLKERKQRERVVFPTMLRKMWSGGEVQAWLDENVNKEKNT